MPKRAYRTGISLLVAVLVSALAASSAHAQDWSTLTPPRPPPPPPQPEATLAEVAEVARWQLGDPVPAGYHVERSSIGRPLAGIGAGLFVVAYVPSFVYGMGGGYVCMIYRGACSSKPALLMIPAIGPFLYAPTDRSPASSTNQSDTLPLINGVMQTGGLVLLLSGLLLDAGAKSSLVPNSVPVATTRVRAQPAVGGGFAGVLVGASF